MGMRYEHVMYAINGYICFFQLVQYPISTPGIDQQHGLFRLENKASIITSGNGGIACSQHDQFCSVLFH
ncbi:hypothetical protein M096_3346 [Parabacteroides distasonis str. 3999B T(B) 6]|nr:hypothetical protein M096_3346 [Parabacteroides distasonis str. 3999B T(B) 6]